MYGFLPDFGEEASGLFTDFLPDFGKEVSGLFTDCTGFLGGGFRIQHLYPYIASASVCIFRFCDQSVPLFSTSRVDFYLTKMVSLLIDR